MNNHITIKDAEVIRLLHKRAKQIKGSSRRQVSLKKIVTKHLKDSLSASINDPRNIYYAHRQKLFEALWTLRPHYCIYCGTFLYETNTSIDHLIPLCRDGAPDSMDNLGLCCMDCNNEKRDLTEWEYRVCILLKHLCRK